MDAKKWIREWLTQPQAVAQVASLTVLEPTVNSISVELKPEYAPRFARVYKARLDGRASIAVTLRCWDFTRGRMAGGELTQPNGRWVLFDPRAVADKILDPLLVPLIQRCVDEIFRLDADFMRSVPSQFTDELGQAWGKLPGRIAEAGMGTAVNR